MSYLKDRSFIVGGMSLGCFVRIGILCLFRIFFVGFGMDFVHAVKADAYVLP